MKLVSIAIVLVTIIAVVISLFRPTRVIIIYAITRPIIQPFIFLHYNLAFIPYSMIWAAILPISFAINIFRKNWTIFCYKAWPLLLLLCISIMSFAFTINIMASVEGILKLITVFCAFAIAYNSVRSIRDADLIVYSVVIASIVPIIFGYYQEIVGNYSQLHVADVDRVNSVFGVGNAYGIFLSITMCAAFIALLNKDIGHKVRLSILSIIGCMLASQILALNRGTWIALIAGLFLALLPYRKKVNVKWFIVGAIVIIIAFSGVIYKRFTEVTYRWDGSEKSTFQGRIDYWYVLIPHILERPFLGHGVGTSGETSEIGADKDPHNDYIRLAFEIGIFGSMVYFYFLLSLSRFYLQRRNKLTDKLLRYNFSMAILSNYIIIISLTQNIIYNLTNIVLFMFLNGATIKLNILDRKGYLSIK